jgi:hypothetical protein
MTGKKDDACGGDSGLGHDVDPMRHLGGHGPAGYSQGPTHTDRADFGDDAPATEAEGETAPKDGEAPESEPAT